MTQQIRIEKVANGYFISADSLKDKAYDPLEYVFVTKEEVVSFVKDKLE